MRCTKAKPKTKAKGAVETRPAQSGKLGYRARIWTAEAGTIRSKTHSTQEKAEQELLQLQSTGAVTDSPQPVEAGYVETHGPSYRARVYSEGKVLRSKSVGTQEQAQKDLMELRLDLCKTPMDRSGHAREMQRTMRRDVSEARSCTVLCLACDPMQVEVARECFDADHDSDNRSCMWPSSRSAETMVLGGLLPLMFRRLSQTKQQTHRRRSPM